MTTDNLRTPNLSLNPVEGMDHSPNSDASSQPVTVRKKNRVYSMVQQIGGETPATLGQRLTVRRLELRLTQEEVASKVLICFSSGEKKGNPHPIARNAYCLYELDKIQPSLKTTEALAKALKVCPAWLGFGIDTFKSKAKKNVSRSKAGIRQGVRPNAGGDVGSIASVM
jgi:transcriptional regulator with XRE-family HTH domain